MLYSCYLLALREEEEEEQFEEMILAIKARYDEIIRGLDLTLDLTDEFQVIRENFSRKIGRDYAASRGEYLNGIGYGCISGLSLYRRGRCDLF